MTEELAKSFEEAEGIITKQRTKEFMLALKVQESRFRPNVKKKNVLRI